MGSRPLVRSIEWFDHATEQLVGRVDLVQTLEELQELFAVPREDPMYDLWEVKPEHVAQLQVWTGQVIDLRKYAVFINAELA